MPSQTLSLSQSQRLQMVLAPQLRQSLEMLQLPILELSAMIQQELEKNPTLEEMATERESVEIEPESKGEEDMEDGSEMDFDKEFEVLTKLDDDWREYFFEETQSRPYSPESEEKRQYFLNSLPQKESLQEHLLNQLHLTGLSDEEVQVGELIIGSINDDGYLTMPLDELAISANMEIGYLEDVLSVIQEFHPTGVGAKDLKDCLLIQLERAGHGLSTEATIVHDHLDQLGARKYQDIAKVLQISAKEVQAVAKIISCLNPKPGAIYSEEDATYVLPEVIVQKIDGRYVVMLDDDQLPHLRISNHYRKLMRNKSTKADVRSYIRNQIKSGSFMIRSIQQRQKTIFTIASEIVEKQTDFLDRGISQLKPMTMAEVADKVGVHETTVSRTVANKYMKTPIGLFELKYFFTPGIKTADGSEVSNKTVKNMIANLVAEEDPLKPFSDQDIMEHLKEKGIHVARRTIAKYRLVLKIPSSHMRKSV